MFNGGAPATEWLAGAANASRSVRSGSGPGRRWASMVFPTPGGPVSMRWCAPAAATSTANRACACPITSARSAIGSSALGGNATRLSRPCPSSSHRNSAARVRTPKTSIPSTRLASARFAAGTTTVGQPRRLAASTAGSTPLTGRTLPSSASSPSSTVLSRRYQGLRRPAERMPTASATSYMEPALGSEAGDNATVSRVFGQLLPQLVTAARTRSRDSCTAASGRPTR